MFCTRRQWSIFPGSWRTPVPFPAPNPIPGRSIYTLHHFVISDLPRMGTFSLWKLQKVLEWCISFLLYKKHFKKNRNASSKTNTIYIPSNWPLFPGLFKIFVSLFKHFNCVQLFCLPKHDPSWAASTHLFSKSYYNIKFQPNSHRCKRQRVYSSQSHSLLLRAMSANLNYNECTGFCTLSEVPASVYMPFRWCSSERQSLGEGWMKLENINNKSKITIDWINNFP